MDKVLEAVARTIEDVSEWPAKTYRTRLAQAVIEAYQDALKEDGYAIVPVEPTFEMCRAGKFSWESPPFPARYKAMIGAVKFGEGE